MDPIVNEKAHILCFQVGIGNCMKNHLIFSVILFTLVMVVGGVHAETAQDWINNGTKLTDQGRYGQALDAYEEALKLNATDVDTWYKKALTLYKSERYDESLTAFEKTTELNPENAKAWYYQGLILDLKGRDDEAVAANNKARMLGYVV